jgi:hypothetical protein
MPLRLFLFVKGLPPAGEGVGSRGYPAKTGGFLEGATLAPVIALKEAQ